MEIVLDRCIKNAVYEIKGPLDKLDDDFIGCYSLIYSFSNENIASYIRFFNMHNKSLLTVGSSGDQAINAITQGCKDVTLLDINPYTKYYYYLKVASILSLSKDEFIDFLYYNHMYANMNYLSDELFNKVKKKLRELSQDSYEFWNYLKSNIRCSELNEGLFIQDELSISDIERFNNYLNNEMSYDKARERLEETKPKFIHGDIYKINLDRKYDNIWLSNVIQFAEINEGKSLINRISQYLSDDSCLIICYLFDTPGLGIINFENYPIYNLDNTLSVFKDYNPKLITVNGSLHSYINRDIKDSVLVHHRKL